MMHLPRFVSGRWARAWVAWGLLTLSACARGPQLPRPSWLTPASVATLRALADQDPRAQRDLGLLLLLDGDQAEEVASLLAAAAERAPEDPLTHLALGVLRSELHRPQDGQASLLEALSQAVAARQRPDWCQSPGAAQQPTPGDCIRLAVLIEEAAARLLRDNSGPTDTASWEQLLARLESQLTLPAAFLLRRRLEIESRAAGDAEAARNHVSRSGAVLRWRAVGPFGPYAFQSFDQSHPPERQALFREAYDLGSGRGSQAPWAPLTAGSSVQLQSPSGFSGTWYAEAVVEAAVTGPVEVRLWTSSPSLISVSFGGEEVLRRDERQDYQPGVQVALVQLEAGRPTRVLVKLASSNSNPAFSLALRDGQGGPLSQLDPAAARGSGRARPLPREDLLALLTPLPGEHIAAPRAFVTALVARARSHPALADETLHRVQRPSPLLLTLRAKASSSTPSAPSSVQQERFLADMRRALAGDPRLWRARIAVARKAAEENQSRQALDLLRQGVELQPDNDQLWHELGLVSRRIGLVAQAEEAFRRALELSSRSCESAAQLASVAHEAGLVAQRESALADLVACDATSTGRAELLADTMRPAEALTELQRLQTIVEFPEGLEDDIVRQALASGDENLARHVLGRLAERWPRSEDFVVSLADLDAATLGPAAGAQRLDQALERYPWEMAGVRRLASVLGRSSSIADFRVDGLEHIRRFLRENPSYDAPSVYVLDRAVYQVFPDGSSLQLVHQISRVQTQDTLDDLSEFTTPRGAEVLTLRAVKADGTLLEPLEFDEAETTNLPGLEVGDFVEQEFITSQGPSQVYPGGVQTPRFYFATEDAAMHLSELIVLYPKDMELDVISRGPDPPRPRPLERPELRGLHFSVQHVPNQVSEPGMPSAKEVYPSVAVVSRERVVQAVTAWSDSHELALRADWRMRELVRGLRRPGQTERDLARAIYDAVIERIQHQESLTPAAHTLASGRGNLWLLYTALLRVAGFEPDIVFAWPISADRSGPYLDPEELGGVLVRVTLDRREHWISLGWRHAPFGYLPSVLQGQPGLIAGVDPREVRVPATSLVPDESSFRLRGRLLADGTLDFSLQETFLGQGAAEAREVFEQSPPAEREVQAGALLAQQFPGAVTQQVSLSGVGDRNAPIELSARAQSRMLGRRESRRFFLPARLQQTLSLGWLVSLSTRRMPLILPGQGRLTLEQELELPPGAQVEQLCPDSERSWGSLRTTIHCSVEGRTLSHRIELILPTRRVSPDEYDELSRLLRGFDEDARAETRIRLP